MRFIRNARAFLAGFAKGWRYTYVNHYADPWRAFWYDTGYGLSYAITGWWDQSRDMYKDIKSGALEYDPKDGVFVRKD